MEDGVGPRMVIFCWPSVWLDPTESYFPRISQHLRLMFTSVNTALTHPLVTFLLTRLLSIRYQPAKSHSLRDTMRLPSLYNSDNIVLHFSKTRLDNSRSSFKENFDMGIYLKRYTVQHRENTLSDMVPVSRTKAAKQYVRQITVVSRTDRGPL